jgi:outer membrane protein assembly factor BamB
MKNKDILAALSMALLFGAGFVVLRLWSCEKTPSPSKPPKVSNALAAIDAHWPIYRGDPSLRGQAQGHLPAEPVLLWSYKTHDVVTASPVLGHGRVYVGSFDEHLYALDLRDGRMVWRYRAQDAVEAPALLREGKVLVGSMDGVLHALDAQAGHLFWTFRTDDKIAGGANGGILLGKGMLWVGSHDSTLSCLDEAGHLLWRVETQSYVNGTPALWKDCVVFGGCDAMLYVVDGRSGTVMAKVDVGSHIAASPAVDRDRAYVGHFGNQLVCVDLLAGKVVWRYDTGRDGGPFFSSPAVTDDCVVAGSQDRKVHCVRKEDGAPRWTFQTHGKVDASPVVCGDRVVVASCDGRLRILRLLDGKLMWFFDLGSPLIASPAVAGGYIVVACEDGRVCAFGKSEEGR